MIEPISGFLSALRQTSPVIFLGRAIATGIIIFVGDETAAKLGLDELRKGYRAQLGGLFIISISIVAAQALWRGGESISSLVKNIRNRRKAKVAMELKQKQLRELTPDEKAYSAPYVLQNQNTQYFQIEDGVTGGLETKGIIYKASSVGSMLTGWAYNIQSWARDYLQKHPELFEGANPDPSGPPSW
jgi:hypothetical protein